VLVFVSSRKSVVQMMLPPIRIRPWSRGMTAPSVADVMRSVSSRAPSMRCAGASDEMIQLSTTEPMVEPMNPPMVAALTPRIAPPILPPMAAPAAPRMRVAMGPRGAWVKGRRS
jgi:hypothetical protein